MGMATVVCRCGTATTYFEDGGTTASVLCEPRCGCHSYLITLTNSVGPDHNSLPGLLGGWESELRRDWELELRMPSARVWIEAPKVPQPTATCRHRWPPPRAPPKTTPDASGRAVFRPAGPIPALARPQPRLLTPKTRPSASLGRSC